MKLELRLTSDRQAVFAGLFSGMAFGAFWVPVRLVEQAGFGAPWAMVIITLTPALMCLPLVLPRRMEYIHGGWGLAGGLLAGIAYALYSASLLYTEVMRAVLLFYLMPIWGFLLGWLILRDRITFHRWLAIGLGWAGMFVIFADNSGIPLPRNVGDWFGVASGMFWAVGAVIILMSKKVHFMTHTMNFFGMAAALSVVVAWLATSNGAVPLPDLEKLSQVLIWFVPVSAILIIPAGIASIFAPTRLNPGIVGLLFMTEIAVAAVTAAMWSGEALTWREIVGLPLIILAGLIEPITWFIHDKKTV